MVTLMPLTIYGCGMESDGVEWSGVEWDWVGRRLAVQCREGQVGAAYCVKQHGVVRCGAELS